MKECKEVISEELVYHMKDQSLANSWRHQPFSLEQTRELHQLADEIRVLALNHIS